MDRNRYSVPASFANGPVSVRVYPERIVVAGEGQVICEHRRVFARSHQRKSTTTVFDWRHYLAVIQRKPGGALTEFLVSISRAANVGLRSDADGLAQIFGAGDLDLLRFAETALKLHQAC